MASSAADSQDLGEKEDGLCIHLWSGGGTRAANPGVKIRHCEYG